MASNGSAGIRDWPPEPGIVLDEELGSDWYIYEATEPTARDDLFPAEIPECHPTISPRLYHTVMAPVSLAVTVALSFLVKRRRLGRSCWNGAPGLLSPGALLGPAGPSRAAAAAAFGILFSSLCPLLLEPDPLPLVSPASPAAREFWKILALLYYPGFYFPLLGCAAPRHRLGYVTGTLLAWGHCGAQLGHRLQCPLGRQVHGLYAALSHVPVLLSLALLSVWYPARLLRSLGDSPEPQIPGSSYYRTYLKAVLSKRGRNGRIPAPADAGGVRHRGRHRRLPGVAAAVPAGGGGAAGGAGRAVGGRGGAAGAARAAAGPGRRRARGHAAGAGHRPPLPLGAGSVLRQLPGAVLPAHLRHAAADPGHAQVQPAGAVPGRGAGRVLAGAHPAPVPRGRGRLDRPPRPAGRPGLPGSPDPAGDFLPLLRGLHLPGGDPAPGRHRLAALQDHPEHVAVLADAGGGRGGPASPGSFPVPGAAFPAEGAHQQARPVHRHLPALPHQRPGGRSGRSVARGHLRPLQRRPPVPAGRQPAAPRRGDLRPRVPHLLPLPEGGGEPGPPAAGSLLPPAAAAPPDTARAAPRHAPGGRPPADRAVSGRGGRVAAAAAAGAVVGFLHAAAQPLAGRLPKIRPGRPRRQRRPAPRAPALSSRPSRPVCRPRLPQRGFRALPSPLSRPPDSLRGFIPKSARSRSGCPEVAPAGWGRDVENAPGIPKILWDPLLPPARLSAASPARDNSQGSGRGARGDSQPPGIAPGAPCGRKFPFPASPFPIPAPSGLRIHSRDIFSPVFEGSNLPLLPLPSRSRVCGHPAVFQGWDPWKASLGINGRLIPTAEMCLFPGYSRSGRDHPSPESSWDDLAQQGFQGSAPPGNVGIQSGIPLRGGFMGKSLPRHSHGLGTQLWEGGNGNGEFWG